MSTIPDHRPLSFREKNKWGAWAAYLAFLVVYTWAYMYIGSIVVVKQNTDRTGRQQSDYIDAVYQSARLAEGGGLDRPSITSKATGAFPQYTNGVVDPLFPWLLRAHADLSPDELFEKGKWFNLVFSCCLLVLFGVIAAKAFSFVGSAAVILMGGFGVILERSAYFSPDALFYLLVVLAWLCSLSLIRSNRLWLYGVLGILLGLGFLAKPLVWPLVVSFVLVSLIRSLALAFMPGKKNEEVDDWSPSNQLVGFAMMISAFILIAGPRMSYASAEYGSPFHSYQNYQVWLDSTPEAINFREDYPGKEELSALTWKTRPGVFSYVQENGFEGLLERAWKGGLEQVKSSMLGRKGWILSYSFFVFLVVGGIHRWTMIRQGNEVWRVRGASARWMLLFLFFTVVISLMHSGIGNRIFAGSSMTTGLFLPLLITFIWIAERYRRQLQRSHQANLVNWVYRALMAVPIVWVGYLIVATIQSASA